MADEKLFQTAPKEVVDYFKRRPSRPTFHWAEMAPREHALGFTVARTAGFDVLDDIRSAVQKAVVDRVPFAQFRDELTPILKAKGWWGVKQITDPRTGEIVKAQLGSLRRLDLIYDANIRSAEAAGDWGRIQRVKDVLPYLEYMTSTSERKRPLHLSWVGTTLPVDDDWWSTHYPPNGWRCKCRARSRAEPRDGVPTEAPPLDPRSWTNRATGETRMVPAGIDPGWDSNPGMSREQMAGKRMTAKLDAMTTDVRRETIAQMRKDPVFEYVVDNGAGYKPTMPGDHAIRDLRWPVAALSDDAARALGTTSRTVAMTIATAEKQSRARRHQPLAIADYDLVQQIIDAPDAVIDDGDLALWRYFGERPWKAVIKRTAEDEILLTSLRPDAAENVGKAAKSRIKGD